MTEQHKPTQGRAVVLGASIAGLTAAAVLRTRFESVVVIDRDDLPVVAAPRRGTPQAIHTHGILARGTIELERHFCGLNQALLDRGGVPADLSGAVAYWFDGARLAMSHSGTPGIAVSRLALEHELRVRVVGFENVEIRSGQEAHGVIVDHGRVSGVRLRDGLGASRILHCDLFVDCSGRGSRLGAWLETYGYQPPEVERVDIGIVYVTANFPRLPEDSLAAVVCGATPQRPWAAAAVAQEPVAGRESWIASVSGYGADAPAADLESFRERVRQVGSSDLERIAAREPLSGLRRYGFPSSQRRRFERLRRFPEGVVAVGDALASFNPVYGQGMTVAAWQATALAAELDAGTADLAQRFHRRAAKIIDIPWQTAVLADLALPVVSGRLSLANRLLERYIGRLQQVAAEDPAVAQAFIRVTHLLDQPGALMRPKVLARVLRGPKTKRATAPNQGPSAVVSARRVEV